MCKWQQSVIIMFVTVTQQELEIKQMFFSLKNKPSVLHVRIFPLLTPVHTEMAKSKNSGYM